jgi:hypothetical protein
MKIASSTRTLTTNSDHFVPGEFRTPILLLVFNRPETTSVVLESIRSVGPAQLYVAADGPRSDVAGEQQRCLEARRVATSIDWNCNVHTLYRDDNVGCALAVSSAITWFFEHEEEGIILEDDCVPSRSFYVFCQDLLERYRNNAAIMHVSGDNFQYGRRRGDASYYFSKYPFIWGWASWRRAWKRYEFESASADVRSSTWDAQWVLALEKYRGAAILPNVNLVTNIGFGADATHTKTLERFAQLPAKEIQFPLRHPTEVSIDKAADTFAYYANFRNVPDLRLIPLYQLWDYFYFRAKKIKRWIIDKEPLT